MISVIVPVYRVDKYLEKCIDSIIGQTYTDLEILLIDDGSPDRCGEICDRYAAVDHRIRVFHTENHGLSAARNLGLEHAEGDYIGFVDSDDWIEPDMFVRLLTAIEDNNADIAVCGRVMEYPDKKAIISPQAGTMNREAAVKALALLKIRNPAWDKLWKRDCFESIRFPKGRVYEDIATTYRIFLQIDRVVCIPDALYHYRFREGSISHDDRLKHLVDYFNATKSETEEIKSTLVYKEDEQVGQILLKRCGDVIARLWIAYCSAAKEERYRYEIEIQDAVRFMRKNGCMLHFKSFSLRRRVILILCCSASWWSIKATRGLIRASSLCCLLRR